MYTWKCGYMSNIKHIYYEEKIKPKEVVTVTIKSTIRLNGYNIPDEQEVRLHGTQPYQPE